MNPFDHAMNPFDNVTCIADELEELGWHPTGDAQHANLEAWCRRKSEAWDLAKADYAVEQVKDCVDRIRRACDE